MKLFKFLSFILFSLFIFSCSDDAPKVKVPFVEAEKCTEYITMKITNPGVSRYASLDGTEGYTASRCQDLGGTYASVAYQGRNSEQKGMVQLVNSKTGVVTSELDMLDARINYTHWHKDVTGEYLYIGVDRKGKDGIVCGIVPVKIKNGIFDTKTDIVTVKPYKVEGWSINCIKTVNNEASSLNKRVMYVAAGGNDALGDSEKAGFTKFLINSENPMELEFLAAQTDVNYRGYWISYDSDIKTPLGYAYRAVKDGKLTYNIGIIPNDVCPQLFNDDITMFKDVEGAELEVAAIDTLVDKGRFCVTPFTIKNSKFIAVCNGNKEFGTRIYRYDRENNQLILVDNWNKACVCLTRICGDSGKYYMFAACGNGVFKLELQYNASDETVYINPIAKRVSTVLTESGTFASVNYVQLTTTKIIHVAGGYEGYYTLKFNDESFIPTDKRK